jgi:hypothetical protein
MRAASSACGGIEAVAVAKAGQERGFALETGMLSGAPRPLAEATKETRRSVARMILFSFLLAFVAARVSVFLIMSRRLPDLYLHLGGTHIHHLNYGIFLLTGVGAYLLFRQPTGRALSAAAAFYGVGLALTYDEFGMWLHLGGPYWQRASWDAVGVVGAALGMIAFAPALKRFRPRHWWSVLITIVVVVFFFRMLSESFQHVRHVVGPRLHDMETNSPR